MEGNCFETYLSLCTPFQFTGQWSFMQAEPQAFVGPADPEAALSALLARHTQDALIAAGIAQRNAGGELNIHAFLSASRVPVVALRDNKLNCVNNLMTGQGCVTGFRYPLFAALLDRHSFSAIEESCRSLILTGTLDETIFLRTFGFAAAPIVGLSALDDHGVTLLGKLFGVRRQPSEYPTDQQGAPRSQKPDDEAAASNVYPSHEHWVLPGCHNLGEDAEDFVPLTIARWSPDSLAPHESAAIEPAIQFLKDLGRFQDVDLFDVNTWSPSSHQLAAMQFGIARRETGWVKSALFASLDLDCHSMTRVQKSTEQLDLTTALEQMREAFLHDNGDRDSSKRSAAAMAAYRGVVHKAFVGPMTLKTQAVVEPFERAAHTVWADLFEVFTEKMLAMRKRMYASAKPNPANWNQGDDKTATPELLAIAKQLTALSKQVVQCSPNRSRSFKPPKRTMNNSSRRFGESDLVMPN